MWIIIGVVIILFMILAIVQTNTFKGYWGERSVNTHLKALALKTGGLEMRDFMFEDTRSSSQIDNMLLTPKALYVIETKNYNGMIFGSLNQQHWTMTVKHVNTYKNKRGKTYKKTNISKHQFYNPVKQNQTHINKINNLTEISKLVPIYNIVVFCKKAVINTLVNDDKIFVVGIKDLQATILTIESSLSKTLAIDEQAAFIDTLYDINITDKKARKAHVKNIKLQYKK